MCLPASIFNGGSNIRILVLYFARSRLKMFHIHVKRSSGNIRLKITLFAEITEIYQTAVTYIGK